MAIGKANVLINFEKLSLKFGELLLLKWKIKYNYNETDA